MSQRVLSCFSVIRGLSVPIYEYECKACGRVLELLQKIDDPAPEACESCNKGPIVKLMSRSGFILKGGGWYVTDSKGGAKKAATESKPESGTKESAPAAEAAKPASTESAPKAPSTPSKSSD
jgi:putative FmdB family regulatory protein